MRRSRTRLNLSVLGELVMDIVLLGLLVYSRHKEDPALDTPLRPGFTLVCLVNPLVLAVLCERFSLLIFIITKTATYISTDCRSLEASTLPSLGFLFQLGNALVPELLVHINTICKLFGVLQLQDVSVSHLCVIICKL